LRRRRGGQRAVEALRDGGPAGTVVAVRFWLAAGSGDERQRSEERQDREILAVLHPTPFRRCLTIVVVREHV